MSRSIPKKRGIVKSVKKKKPARYTQKVDSIGRRYTIDKTTGTRVSNELWKRERAKLRKAREKKSLFDRAVEAREQALRTRTQVPESIPRNIFDVWDIPNVIWKREQEAVREQEWEPEEWTDRDPDHDILFPYEKEEREAELKFRAEKAERDRELLQSAEQFIPTDHIKGFSEGLVERAQRYPRVLRALELASAKALIEETEALKRYKEEGKKPTPGEEIRSRFLHAIEQKEDIESVAGDLAEQFEVEVHGIYEIYFSPEVA